MKIYNIEIEDGPFNDEYLDDCIKNIDITIDLHLSQSTNFFDTIKGVFETVEGEGVGKIVYIHNYPKELIIIIGVKIIKLP